MIYCVRTRLMIISVCCLALSIHSMKAEATERLRNISPADIHSLLSRESTNVLEREIADCVAAPLYQRLWMSSQLVESLPSDKPCKLVDYFKKEGEHDLATVSGRAAYAIERVLGIALPVSVKEGGHTEVADLQKTVSKTVRRLREAELARSKDQDIQPLRKKYCGKIHPGIHEHAHEDLRLLLSLFAEWFPLGKRLEQLDKIICVTGRRTDAESIYMFDDGSTRIELRVVVIDGAIDWVITEAK